MNTIIGYYIGGVHLWGITINRVIAIAGITNLVAFVVTTVGILWSARGDRFSRADGTSF